MYVDGRLVAPWIGRELRRARRHGWTGVVISGWRSRRSQREAAEAYARRLGRPLRDVYPNGVQASAHRGLRWPRGAVDVTKPDQLNAVLQTLPRRRSGKVLRWAWPVIGDWAHFSSNGH